MDNVEKYLLRSAQTRGGVLSICTLFEQNLNGVLSKYFCRDEEHQKELVKFIFGSSQKINLKTKCRTIIEILKSKIGQEEYEKKYTGLQKRFDDFLNIRNEFAHDADLLAIDNSHDKYELYAICLMDTCDMAKTKFYNQSDIDNILIKTQNLLNELIDKIYPDIINTNG